MEGEKRKAGEFGERIACQYLKAKGLILLAKNWSCRAGEVDLVMQYGSTLVFVEVRLRRPTAYGEGLDTVAFEKQRKLIKTARFYQQKENYWGDIRFDVISIVTELGGAAKIEHIEDAFEADG